MRYFPAYIIASALLLGGCVSSRSVDDEHEAVVEEYLKTPYQSPEASDYPREIRVAAAHDLRKEWGKPVEVDETLTDPRAPRVQIELLSTYDDNRNYYAVVNFKNPTTKNGNKTVHTFAYDKLGRLVFTESRTTFFRAYQQFNKLYSVAKDQRGAPIVRWVIMVK